MENPPAGHFIEPKDDYLFCTGELFVRPCTRPRDSIGVVGPRRGKRTGFS